MTVRLAEVPNVVQGGQEHPLFELLGRAPEHRPPAPPALPATGSRLPSRRGRSRSACVVNARLRHEGEGRLPASAAVCLIPCLILSFAYVESVCKCRAPNSPGGLNGQIASVIASPRARPTRGRWHGSGCERRDRSPSAEPRRSRYAQYFDRHNVVRASNRLTKRLEAIGFQVQLTTA